MFIVKSMKHSIFKLLHTSDNNIHYWSMINFEYLADQLDIIMESSDIKIAVSQYGYIVVGSGGYTWNSGSKRKILFSIMKSIYLNGASY